MKTALSFALSCLAAVFAIAQAPPPESTAADHAALVAGVTSLPRFGAPGPVVAYAEKAFSIATSHEGKSESPVAAAGTLGKGRAVIFGQTGYLNGESDTNLDRLLLNAARWCGHQEQPRVALRGGKLGPAALKAGLVGKSLAKLDARSLAECDVVILSVQNLTDLTEARALHDYLANGGGLIAAMTGWAFGQTSGGQEFSANLGNSVLADAGLAWTDDSLGGGKEPLEVSAEPKPMLNAMTAMRQCFVPAGSPPPTPEMVEQGALVIRRTLDSIPPASRTTFQQVLAKTFAAPRSLPFPAPGHAMGADEAAAHAQAGLESRLFRFLAPADVKAHPAAEKFPGRVAPGARVVAKTVTVDPKIPGWHSTGLYADAGAQVTVELAAQTPVQGLGVRIGCHTDALYAAEKWRRLPEISTSTPLTAGPTTLASPFGGLVYVMVPDKAKQEAPFTVTIRGAVEAPYFVLGKTTDAQWKAMAQLGAPWAELECPGVILSLPAEVARAIANPTELMQYWQKVIEAEDDLSNVAALRRRPERIVPDVQISAGFMHSGYPIMIHLPEAKEMTTVSGNTLPGWGFYHELGHNHQKPEWTPEGTVEVTCNIFSLYITEVLQGRKRGENHSAIKPETRAQRTATYLAAGAPYEKWKADPFLALDIYEQLIDGFGWETMKKVLRSYQGNEFGPLPKSDEEKRDQWMVRYSKVSGKNLGPLFAKWGIPVSAAARAEVEGLGAWTPN